MVDLESKVLVLPEVVFVAEASEMASPVAVSTVVEEPAAKAMWAGAVGRSRQ